MADWAFVPLYPYIVRRIGPTTLITAYEDLSETRREKSSTVKRIFREKHVVSGSTLDSMLDFYHTKGKTTAFSKVTFDVRDAADTETNVRFMKEPAYTRSGFDEFSVTLDFRET